MFWFLFRIFPFSIYAAFCRKGFITIYDMFLLNEWPDGMNRKREKKTDLLDLPLAERKRLCFEIRAALRERVSASNGSFSDDPFALITKKSVRKSRSVDSFDDKEGDTRKHPSVLFGSGLKKC